MQQIIQKLVDYKLITEVWPYLKTIDICHLLVVSKNVRLMSLYVNKLVPKTINLRLDRMSEEERIVILNNVLFSFQNIYSLKFYYNKSSLPIDQIGMSLSLLYENNEVCKNLKKLSLLCTDKEGIYGISNLINIKTLELSLCNISNKVLLEISSMVNIESLAICNSRSNEITDEGMSQIWKLTKLKSLTIISCYWLFDNGLKYISTLTKMTNLNLILCQRISDAGLHHLSNLTNITSLDLSNNAITTLYSLTSFVNITYLNLKSCRFLTDDGLYYLSYMTKITKLDLSNCSKLTANGLTHLKSLTHIKVLNLIDNKITNIGLSHIGSLSSLETLSMIWNEDIITNDGLIHLCKLNNLITLVLNDLNFYSINTSMNDINLSPEVFNKLVSLRRFRIKAKNIKGAFLRKPNRD
jgi:hypothetical protein